MKKLVPSKGVKSKQIKLKNEIGNEIPTSETSGFIDTFFSEIGPKLAEKHNSEWSFGGTIIEETMPDIIIDDNEVLKVIKELNENKSSAIDYISTKAFKHSVLAVPNKFIKILKLSLKSSKIPNSWKKAKVTPLPKSGDMSNVSNYRPISQLPVPGNVLERIVHTKITSHLENCNILLKEQGGYHKKCSTIDTISVLTNDILRNRNVGNITMAAFLDIKKAFDSVNYIILLNKLEHYGIRGLNLHWIRNYFTDRTQVTVCNNVCSDVVDMTCGAPQGSILGPLFFLLYVNDLKARVNGVKTLLYADDTVLYVSGKNLHDISQSLQMSLNNFISWSSKNKLTLNASKTKLMLFASPQKYKTLPLLNLNIKANDEKLKFVTSYKYLGVTLDYELNFNLHVKELKKNLAFRSYLLANLKHYVPTNIMLKIYKVYTLPLFDYADVLYHGANGDILDRLQRIQNRCLKYCLKLPILTSTNIVHQLADLPKLCDRRLYHAKLYGFKRSKKEEFINVRPRITRIATAPLLYYDIIHASSYENSVEVFTAQAWNALPPSARDTESISSFKKLMKKELKVTVKNYKD